MTMSYYKFPILRKYQEEIATRTQHDFEHFLIFYQSKQLISCEIADQYRNNQKDSNYAKGFHLLNYIMTKNREEVIIVDVIEALKRYDHNELAGKLESEAKMTEIQEVQGNITDLEKKVKDMKLHEKELDNELEQVMQSKKLKNEKLENLQKIRDAEIVEFQDLVVDRLSSHTLTQRCAFMKQITMKTKNIYLIGGYVDGNKCTSFIREYNPSKGVTTTLANLNTARRYHSVGLHPQSNEIIVAGGFNEKDEVLSSVECYDPLLNQCHLFPDMQQKRHGAASCILDGKFYVIGGGDGKNALKFVEYFDLTNRTWKSITDLPNPLTAACAIGVKDQNGDSTIFVFGGFAGSPKDTVYQYSTSERSWQCRADLVLPIAIYCSAITIWEGKIVLCGGNTSPSGAERLPSNQCHYLDLVNCAWVPLPPLLTARCLHQVVVLNNKLVVMGGLGVKNVGLRSVEVFDGGNTWVEEEPLDIGLWLSAAVVL